jgi:hypothetical protein
MKNYCQYFLKRPGKYAQELVADLRLLNQTNNKIYNLS